MAQLVDDRKSATIERRAKLFRGFADPSRLAILGALCNEPLAVHEIVERTELSQPNVSNHLRCLLDCGLVASDREGRFIRYRTCIPARAFNLKKTSEIADNLFLIRKLCDLCLCCLCHRFT